MRPIRLTLIAIASAFSAGIANADGPPETEVIIVTAPKPKPIENLELALPDEVEPDIDYTRLTLEPPRLDPPSVKVERPVELALNEEPRKKS